MRRLLILATVGFTAATALAATAAPSATGVTHANNHVCTAAPAGVATCHAIRHDTYINGKPAPSATSIPAGAYGRTDLVSAYGLPSSNSSGAGTTVAIVDAYDLPTAFNDVSVYRAQYGLPTLNTGGPTFRQVGQNGGTVPAANASWGQEIALDIEMVSATCPSCNILLVEANSASFADLGAAVNYAASQGVAAISNSYGGSDTSPSTAYDHKGIAITASTGDNGYGVESPASYNTVVAVGGTSLTKSTSGTYSETAWSGAGSGCSRYNSQQPWQSGVVTNCGTRALADVSAVADPNTGVAVYDSTAYQGQSGWMQFGGTSVSSPIIASIYALGGNLAGYPAQYTYAHRTALHDITSGANGHCTRTRSLCTAGTGWDGPTGLGTPSGITAF